MSQSLKQLIESLVAEALSDIEEVYPIDKGRETPHGSPFGRFLWADLERADGKKEKDNRLETVLLTLLRQWYEGNSFRIGVKLVNLLSDFRDHGILGKYFEAPAGESIYRYVSLPVDKASEILGVPADELKERSGNVEAYTAGSGVLRNPNRHLSSWSIDLNSPDFQKFATTSFGEVAMLFKATVKSKGWFYLNPEELLNMFGDQISRFLSKEKEVLVVGPVEYDKVVYFVQGRKGKKRKNEAFLSSDRIYKMLSGAIQ